VFKFRFSGGLGGQQPGNPSPTTPWVCPWTLGTKKDLTMLLDSTVCRITHIASHIRVHGIKS